MDAERVGAREASDGHVALIAAPAAFELGRFARAVDLAERALQLDPGNADARTLGEEAAAGLRASRGRS